MTLLTPLSIVEPLSPAGVIVNSSLYFWRSQNLLVNMLRITIHLQRERVIVYHI